MTEFLTYFSTSQAQLSEKQLQQLADWINEAVSTDGDLENAVSTCFLEHMRQVRINRVLKPYLSQQAKAKSRGR